MRDPAGEGLTHEEVEGSPGDALADVEETGGDYACGDGLLAEVHVAGEVDFDATGEIEAALDVGVDGGEFSDLYHQLFL
jgi:hypothetical protein